MIYSFHIKKRGEVIMDTIWLILIGVFVALVVVFVIFKVLTSQRRPQVEAIEEDRRPMDRREFVPFDEEAAEVLERRIVRCSKCDEEVSPYDDYCPHCEARLTIGAYECSNCGKDVDPRDKECPHCGEILLPDPYVCPVCGRPVEQDSTKCDSCGAKYWSPILLDEASLKRKKIAEQPQQVEEEEEVEEERPRRRRAYR
jgi:DNA-directed RNA polymerase subunit RPC12/RpoP